MKAGAIQGAAHDACGQLAARNKADEILGLKRFQHSHAFDQAFLQMLPGALIGYGEPRFDMSLRLFVPALQFGQAFLRDVVDRHVAQLSLIHI